MNNLGEVCTCCSNKRDMQTLENRNRPPRRLKRIGSKLTQNKKLVVVGCEHCDGPHIFTLAARAAQD